MEKNSRILCDRNGNPASSSSATLRSNSDSKLEREQFRATRVVSFRLSSFISNNL